MASISMSEIKVLVGSTSSSLREYSRLAGFSAPDSMTEFIGYNPTPDPIDFTYTAGGSYKNEGTLLVTSATGGVGTKVWYLNNGSAGAYTGPYAINTNTQTGLGNQIYTMKVEDSATPTPNFKIYQHTFNLPRRVGTSMTLYWVLKSTYPSPTSTSGWSSGTVETNTFTTGTPAQIFAAASKFLIGNSISGQPVTNYWVSDGTSYKDSLHLTSGDADAFFEVAINQILNSTTGAGTTFPAPTRYAFTRYNVDVNCDDSNATEVWSFTNYSDGYYTIGGTLYRLVSASHTNYTTEITTATASSCTPASDCECYTIYNEGDTSGQYRYNRCSDGSLVTGNIPRNTTQTICVSNGGTVEILSGELTDVPCGTPCNINGDCTAC
jgi:hypothetical protein